MSGSLNLRYHSSGAQPPEDIEDLLEVAEEFERELAIEPGAILRHLSDMLRRQIQLQELRKDFDVRRR